MVGEHVGRRVLMQADMHTRLGDSRHVVAYTIAGGDAINVVFIHPEPSDPSTWRQETALEDMKREFAGWDFRRVKYHVQQDGQLLTDCRITKLISLIDQTLKWPMMASQGLDRWVSESNKVVIIGDAAHAMLPFMSQGMKLPARIADCC